MVARNSVKQKQCNVLSLHQALSELKWLGRQGVCLEAVAATFAYRTGEQKYSAAVFVIDAEPDAWVVAGVVSTRGGVRGCTVRVPREFALLESIGEAEVDRLRKALLGLMATLSFEGASSEVYLGLARVMLEAVSDIGRNRLSDVDIDTELELVFLGKSRMSVTPFNADAHVHVEPAEAVELNAVAKIARDYVSANGQSPWARPILAPSRRAIRQLCDGLLTFTLRGCENGRRGMIVHADLVADELLKFRQILKRQIQRSLLSTDEERCWLDASKDANEMAASALAEIPRITEFVAEDAIAGVDKDPSVETPIEFALMSQGIRTIAIQRFAHVLYESGVPLIPRMMTEVAHSRYGIDIHPGAKLGRRLVIDHGSGVVIGETAIVGDDCTLYQCCTLGAYNFPRDENGSLTQRGKTKRHPTLEDHVTVFANATILGGETTVGSYSTIGANVRLTRSVPPESIVTIQVNPPDVKIRVPKQMSIQLPDWKVTESKPFLPDGLRVD